MSRDSPSSRIAQEADGPSWRIAGTGSPRIARTCSANSLRSCETSVTRPVSCGRGDTSLNHTSSPRTKSSTPKMPASAERIRHGARDPLRFRQCHGAHRLRLPGLAVVTVHLQVPDGSTEARAAGMPHREQRDLVVETDEALDDDATGPRATALLRVVPRMLNVGGVLHQALALAGGAHHRFHDAGKTESGHGVPVLAHVGREPVRRGRKPEFLRGEAPDPLAVHRQAGRPCRRDHAESLALELDQRRGRDRLDLGHDEAPAVRAAPARAAPAGRACRARAIDAPPASRAHSGNGRPRSPPRPGAAPR